MVAAGASDPLIANRLGGLSRGSARRHRIHHIERVTKAVLQAVNKGRDVRESRERAIATAEQGDIAAAFFGITQLATDIKNIYDRLERAASAAESGQRHLISGLAGQQLRAAEVRAKLGGVGGYATPRTEKPSGEPFVLNIIFSDRETIRIEGTPMHPDDPAFNAGPVVPLSISGTSSASGIAEEQEDAAEFDEDV